MSHSSGPAEFPLIFETPDGSVKFPATFYCYFGGVLDGHLGFEYVTKPVYFPPVVKPANGRARTDPDWIPASSPYFVPQEVPADVGPECRHYRLTADADMMAQFVAPMRLVSDIVASHIPDFMSWPPFGLVSEHARELLEQLDPDGSVFIPADVNKSNGEPIASRHFHWVPRNRLIFDEPPWSPEQRARHVRSMPFPGPFARPTVAWQLTENTALRVYLGNIPFWGFGTDMIRYAFNATAFSVLRGHKCTGLVENTAAFAGDRKMHESIGHIP